MGPILDQLADGQLLFDGITASKALVSLREILERSHTPEARAYGTHDLRRGHARDLQRHGASLYEILMAGEWRSPAFMHYLDTNALEADLVVQAHVAESSDSE